MGDFLLMGKTALRLLASGLLGVAITLVSWLLTQDAPGSLNPVVWGLITAVAKFVLDMLVAAKGPANGTVTGGTTGGF